MWCLLKPYYAWLERLSRWQEIQYGLATIIGTCLIAVGLIETHWTPFIILAIILLLALKWLFMFTAGYHVYKIIVLAKYWRNRGNRK